MITGAAKVAGVVGWPVKHSLSPLIHNAWIEALGLDAVYVPFAVPPERLAKFLRGLTTGAVSGLNVTMPHKRSAFEFADLKSDAAWNASVANLLLFSDDDSALADNTDGAGLADSLLTAGWVANGGPVLVLGSGGAAEGAVAGLRAAGAQDVRVAARSFDAQFLSVNANRDRMDYIGGGAAHSYAFSELNLALRDVTAVINATSAGLNGIGELPAMDAAPPGAVFMDMVYSPLRTKFLRDAEARGHPTVDGLAMLIGQARPSFEAFYGVPPPPPEVVDVRALCLKALGEME